MLTKLRLTQIFKNLNIKYLHFCVLCFFYLINAPLTLAQIDSLENLLSTLPDNTQKVDVLNELSYLYHNNDIEQTFAYANEAYALTNQLNYLKGKAKAFHNLCIAKDLPM